MNEPTRRRALASARTKPEPTPEMTGLAAKVIALNAEMNAAKRQHDEAREMLLARMKDAGISSFDGECRIDGRTVAFSALLETPQRTVIDVAKLQRLVGGETFLAVVTASKSAVEKAAGAAVAAQCSVLVAGSENVTVKPTKPGR